MPEIHPRARCPHRTGKKRKYWAANLQTMCRKRRSHRPAWWAVICAHVGMRASRLTWPGVQCALPRAPQGQTLFSNALNPYKHYLIHQQGGREVFPVALFYCSRFIALVLLLSLNRELIQRSYTHRGCGSASSSCRGTFRQCRTQLPSPAHAWPCWDRTSTRQYRRGGAGQ